MKKPDYLTIVREASARHQCWLAGMDWAPLEKKRVSWMRLFPQKTRGKAAPGKGVSALSRPGQSIRVGGQGRIPARRLPGRLYSLALAFSLQVRNGYGIYRLNGTDFVFLASVNGAPAVTADKTGSLEQMQAYLSLFLAMNEAPPEAWMVQSPLDEAQDYSTLLGALSERNKRQCRAIITGQSLRRWLPAIVVVGAAGAAIVWEASEPEPPALTPEEIQARAREMFSREVPDLLPHPWASQMTVPDLLSHCQQLQDPAPIVINGWEQTTGICSAEGVVWRYRIMPGGTAEDFQKGSLKYFGVPPVFNLKEGGREATVTLPLPASTMKNDVLPDAGKQFMRILTWFQRRQITLNLTEVPLLAALPGENGSPPPVQDWNTYSFQFTSQLPPTMLFSGMDDTGIRLTQVRYERNGSAFSYTTEGKIYASTK